MENKRAQWSSHLSFMLATIGGAVGLGNIWRFPYIMGKNGGAIFLFTYLLLIAFICAIPLCMELAMGKLYRSDAITIAEKISPKFKWFGIMCMITAILIPCYYFVVGGWIIHYLWIFITNNVPSDFQAYFSTFNSNPYIPLFLTFLFLFFTAIFPYRGVNQGVEKANNIMMPVFAFMLFVLAGYSLTLPGAKEGLLFMFKPNFAELNSEMVLCALGQALFTLSIGMGAMMTYGSYLKPDTNILKSSYSLIFFDTLVAITAGIMIFPIVFTNGVEPTAGATLVFISLPQIFMSLPLGNFLAVLFFFLLLFAAITSGISLLETSISCLSDHFHFTRKKATLIISLITALFAVPASLSFGSMADFKIYDKTFFDFLDFMASNILLPLGTLVICICAGWFCKNIRDEVFSNSFFGRCMKFLLKFVLPVVFLCVLIMGLK